MKINLLLVELYFLLSSDCLLGEFWEILSVVTNMYVFSETVMGL